jgi:hypothetical protein
MYHLYENRRNRRMLGGTMTELQREQSPAMQDLDLRIGEAQVPVGALKLGEEALAATRSSPFPVMAKQQGRRTSVVEKARPVVLTIQCRILEVGESYSRKHSFNVPL